MGCDIHIRIERQHADGTWLRVPYVVEHWMPRDEVVTNDRKAWERIDAAIAAGAALLPSCFISRNYDLFGILADVRNGTGFAGIYTGAGWKSIAPRRGFPVDTLASEDDGESPDAAEDDDDRWLGDHSFTHIALDELRAFGWDTVVSTSAGLVGERVWRAWIEARRGDPQAQPATWCGDATGLGLRKITEADAYRRLQANVPLTSEEPRAIAEPVLVRAEWQVTARAATYDWPGRILPILEQIAGGQPLRLVLGFDS